MQHINAEITVTRSGHFYQMDLIRNGAVITRGAVIKPGRAQEIISQNPEGAVITGSNLDFGERPCEWMWQARLRCTV